MTGVKAGVFVLVMSRGFPIGKPWLFVCVLFFRSPTAQAVPPPVTPERAQFPPYVILSEEAQRPSRRISENKNCPCHPERQSRDLVQNRALFRTRFFTWLPPQGEAGAERLMRGILSLFLDGAVNNEDETTLILVAGKAPRQTAHCVCRLARCVCRSSSQKVLRYFLGALYMRALSPLKRVKA